MNSPSASEPLPQGLPPHRLAIPRNRGLQRILHHLTQTLQRDVLVQQTVCHLRDLLQSDRVVLYYFYRQWKGQVTFEALSAEQFSILGSTGADDCFGQEYAVLYQEGRVRSIADVEHEPLHECHRDFLRSIQVRSNLVIPVVTNKGLWGLLIAHHCQTAHTWTEEEIEHMRHGAATLANSPAIQES